MAARPVAFDLQIDLGLCDAQNSDLRVSEQIIFSHAHKLLRHFFELLHLVLPLADVYIRTEINGSWVFLSACFELLLILDELRKFLTGFNLLRSR